MGIYVVGMHRSGTSAVAAVVSALGDLPANRLVVDANPDGQWERAELRPALDLLLLANGATWDHPPAAEAAVEAPRWWRAYANRVAGRHLAGDFVWKDPRLSLCIDLWLDRPQPEPRVVLVHRHPSAVAASLASREGWSGERALALWERTTRNALVRLGGREVFAVAHERLVADPTATVDRLADWLGFADRHRRSRAADLVDPRAGSGASAAAVDAHPSPAQLDLARLLDDRHGPTRLDPAALRPETPATATVLGHPGPGLLARRTARAIRLVPRRHRSEVAGAA
ncbi:MAG: sulfotransferase [Actinomycetota bacterium]